MRNLFNHEPVIDRGFPTAMEKLGDCAADILAFGLWQRDVKARRKHIDASPNVVELPHIYQEDEMPNPAEFKKYLDLATALNEATPLTVRIIPVQEPPYDYEADTEIS